MFHTDVVTSRVIGEWPAEWQKGEERNETLSVERFFRPTVRGSKRVCVTFMSRIEGEGWRCIVVVLTPSKRTKRTCELRKRRSSVLERDTSTASLFTRFFVGFFGSASTRNQAGSVERSAIVWPRAADLYLYQPGTSIFFSMTDLSIEWYIPLCGATIHCSAGSLQLNPPRTIASEYDKHIFSPIDTDVIAW